MLIGIVGAPNKGKSTLFSALTLTSVEMADYPFTTIKPNEGIGYVKVEDVGVRMNINPKPKHGYIMGKYRFIPVKLLDVAGLVPGAHEGKGLGNQFLNDLIPSDALIHVIDVSGETDLEGKRAQSDPLDEVRFLEDELDYWLMGIIKKNWGKVRFKKINSLSEVLSGLKVSENDIENVADKLKLDKERLDWDDDEILKFSRMIRKISKPIIIAANKCDLPSSKDNIERLKSKGYDVIPTSAIAELTLKRAAQNNIINYIPGDDKFEVIGKLSEEQKKGLDYIKNHVLDVYGSTGVQQLINRIAFDKLHMIIVYPVEDENKLSDTQGNVLPEAKLVPAGTTPYQLAGLIHTDIQKGYITAIDVTKKMRIGKDTPLQNNSIIKIVFRN
ncbi:redox-regulated ATPase YchF [Candidatus Micrarchaeota archaeon]|nr:redox-regulated ATPase YchF [Candidatus Micrarchaeota archaeon]